MAEPCCCQLKRAGRAKLLDSWSCLPESSCDGQPLPYQHHPHCQSSDMGQVTGLDFIPPFSAVSDSYSEAALKLAKLVHHTPSGLCLPIPPICRCVIPNHLAATRHQPAITLVFSQRGRLTSHFFLHPRTADKEEHHAVNPNLLARALTRYGRVRQPQRCSIVTRVSCSSRSAKPRSVRR